MRRHRCSRPPSCRRLLRIPRRKLAIAVSLLLLVVAGAAVWWQPWTIIWPPTQVERFAYPLPDKPSVAVLPFINVSGDTDHDHLAEGLTDDLITELSKVSGLFVIARHSVFAVSNVGRQDSGCGGGTRGPLRPGRHLAEGGHPAAHQRQADRRGYRPLALGRAIRSSIHRPLRGSGRRHRQDHLGS